MFSLWIDRSCQELLSILSGFDFVGQFSSQARAPIRMKTLIQSFGRSAVRPTIAPRTEAGSSFGAQGA